MEGVLYLHRVKVAQSCPTVCNPVDNIVHGILQARILEWVAFPFSRGSSQPRDQTQVSRIAGGFFTSWATREALILMTPCCGTCEAQLPLSGLVNLPNQCSKILSQDSKIITWIFLPTLIHRNGDINGRKWKSLSHVRLFATQARILKWIAFPFSRGSSQPRDRT